MDREPASNVICNQERLKEEEVVSWGTFHSRDLSSSLTASVISALSPLFSDQAKTIKCRPRINADFK